MLRFLLSIEEEELGDDIADMIACSTDEICCGHHLQNSNTTHTCCCETSEFTRFIETLSNSPDAK